MVTSPPVAEKNLFFKKMTRITHHICATTAHCNATFSVFTQDVNVLCYSPLYLPMPRSSAQESLVNLDPKTNAQILFTFFLFGNFFHCLQKITWFWKVRLMFCPFCVNYLHGVSLVWVFLNHVFHKCGITWFVKYDRYKILCSTFLDDLEWDVFLFYLETTHAEDFSPFVKRLGSTLVACRELEVGEDLK